MSVSREDQGQGFSGVSRSANPVTSRHIHKGGNQPADEPVGLNPIDKSRGRGLNENAMPGSVRGHDPSSHGEEGGGEVGRGDAPFAIPRDQQGTDKPDFFGEKQLDYEWGRRPPELNTCRWEEFAVNPGYKIDEPDSLMPMRHNPGMKATMDEWKAGKLHSGSKKGPVVKSRAQAIAIGLSEAGKSNQ